MSVNLLEMVASFGVFGDQENPVAWFRTLLPWVAPKAYLNIIFKPAPQVLLDSISKEWCLPDSVSNILRMHNGAHLFSGSIDLLGVVQPGQLLNRSDVLMLPPFNLEKENESWTIEPKRLLVIGGYGFDGSSVCVDRDNEHVHWFERGQRKPTVSWKSMDDWLTQEIGRLSALFEPDGHRICEESDTLPPIHH